MPEVNPLSASSLLVAPTRDGDELARATAFIARLDGEPFLVTNWHVVAGRNTHTGRLLDPGHREPDALSVLHVRDEPELAWASMGYRLYDSDGEPLWLEHPQHGHAVDVVALPIPRTQGLHYNVSYVVPGPPPGEGLLVGPATPVTTIGFPFSLTGGAALGVWSQGTIASDPVVDYGDLPSFLIDSRTRQGQSGSPVLLYHRGGWATMADHSSALVNPHYELLGVYSGRVSEESDLGVVWKTSALLEILRARQRASRPDLTSGAVVRR